MPSCSLKPCQNWGGQYPGMGGQYHRNMQTNNHVQIQWNLCFSVNHYRNLHVLVFLYDLFNELFHVTKIR